MSDSNPVAVVTGASSGIGAATAELLAQNGWSTVLVARGRDALEEVAGRISSAGGLAAVEALDAGNGEAVLEMAARVREQHGIPAAIVNSAGAGQWRFIEETPPADAEQMMRAPYHAAYNLSHAFMPDLLARRRGVIVHVGSPASRLPWPGCTAYSAARWALRGLHEALVQDLRGTGVSSCHVIFGEVASAYFSNNPGSHEHIPTMARLIRILQPEECARVIARVIARPRRQVVHPLMLRLFYWNAALTPGLVRWLVAATGRRH